MGGKMNFRIAAFYAFLSLSHTACLAATDYVVVLESLDNHPEASREFVDWHFQLRRISKYEKVPDGYYVVKKDVIGPKFSAEAYVKSNDKFFKVGVNELRTQSMCDESIQTTINSYFRGNSTTDLKNCTISPGYMEVSKAARFNPTEFARSQFSHVIYGTYKFETKITNVEGVVVCSLGWTMNVARRK